MLVHFDKHFCCVQLLPPNPPPIYGSCFCWSVTHMLMLQCYFMLTYETSNNVKISQYEQSLTGWKICCVHAKCKRLPHCDKYWSESLKSQLLFWLNVCEMWLRGLSIAQPHVWDRCCLNPNAHSRQRVGWETGVCVSVRQTVHSTVTERSELVGRVRYRKSVRQRPGRTCGWHAEGWCHLPGVSQGKAGSWKSMAQKFEYMLGLILRDGTD